MTYGALILGLFEGLDINNAQSMPKSSWFKALEALPIALSEDEKESAYVGFSSGLDGPLGLKSLKKFS